MLTACLRSGAGVLIAFVFPGALGLAMGEELTESGASRKSRAAAGGMLVFVGVRCWLRLAPWTLAVM